MTIPLQAAGPWKLEADGLVVGGLLLGVAAAVHVAVFPDPLAMEAIELSVAVGVSVVLIYGGYWLRTSDVDVEVVRSLARSTLAGTVATGLAFAWFLVHQWLAGVGVDEPFFVILSSASGGAAIGLLAGAHSVGAFAPWTGQHGWRTDDRRAPSSVRESPGTGPRPGVERQVSLDALFDALGTRRSRYALYYLRRAEDGVATIDEIADHVERWETRSGEAARSEGKSVRVDLQHTVLPKLAAIGLLDYDARSRTIRYWRHPLVEQWLARTAPHDLPTADE